MALWRQLVVALVLVAATGVGWALWVPAAAPVLARLGVPTPAPADAPPAPGFGGGSGGGPGGPPGPAIVAGAPVGEGRANARVAAIGDGRALRSVAVRPLDSGRLVAVEVASGAAVASGDVIARLDADVEAIALERARLVAADAEETYARVEALRGRGAATHVQEREARLALERARLEARDAEVALDRRTIRAPIGGVVGIVAVEPGMQVDDATEIATVEDRTRLLVEFRVPERAVGAIAVGDPVAATPLARPELALDGRVSALDNRVDPDSRTLRVQAELPNDDDRLRSGMAFAVEMRLPGEPYPEIEALAIQWGADGAFVWVERDGAAIRAPVRIVQRNAERVLVAADLAPGERVISEGVQRLRDGAPVRFLGDQPPAAADASGAARVPGG
jgi:RND family efflux transporter MFP subunit